MDDIRPPRQTGVPTNYGRQPINEFNPHPQQYPSVQHAFDPNQPHPDALPEPIAQENLYTQPVVRSSKKCRFFLILFILISFVLGGVSAWLYLENTDLTETNSELRKENDRLEQKVYSLNYDNRDLSTKLELSQSENASLEELNQELLDTCGNACSSIIPLTRVNYWLKISFSDITNRDS